MNIAKVSTFGKLAMTNREDSVTAGLEKQKLQLTKQIEVVRASSMDTRLKTEKLKGLNEQLTALDKEITQAKIDAQQRKLEEERQKNVERAAESKQTETDDEYKNSIIVSTSLHKLIAAQNHFTAARESRAVACHMKGEAAVAKAEIRNNHGGSVKYQLAVFDKAVTGLVQSEHRASTALQAASADLRVVEKLALRAAENERHMVKNDIGTEDMQGIVAENSEDSILPLADNGDGHFLSEEHQKQGRKRKLDILA